MLEHATRMLRIADFSNEKVIRHLSQEYGCTIGPILTSHCGIEFEGVIETINEMFCVV